MKKCPVCSRTYTDQTIAFCLEDGTVLTENFTPTSVTQQYDPAVLFTNQEKPFTAASNYNDEQNPPRLTVSVIACLTTAISDSIPLLGLALSSIFLIDVSRVLSNAENAGIDAVMGGLNEASVPVYISLYLAA